MKRMMNFYREWLSLDKSEFRILAMLADKKQYTGYLSGICRYFGMSSQTKQINKLKDSIQSLVNIGLVEYSNSGRTIYLKPIPTEHRIQVPRRWAKPIMEADGFSESVAWEQVLKVYVWIYDNHHPEVTNAEIANDLNISVDTIGLAKNVLEKDFNAIFRSIVKVTDNKGQRRNVGQSLSAKIWWSE